MNTFGERFKSIRLSKNLTQQQLVNEFNKLYGYAFTKTTISQYENNKRIPEMNAIRNFVEYFNVSLDYLLCNDTHVIKELEQEYCYETLQFAASKSRKTAAKLHEKP